MDFFLILDSPKKLLLHQGLFRQLYVQIGATSIRLDLFETTRVM